MKAIEVAKHRDVYINHLRQQIESTQILSLISDIKEFCIQAEEEISQSFGGSSVRFYLVNGTAGTMTRYTENDEEISIELNDGIISRLAKGVGRTTIEFVFPAKRDKNFNGNIIINIGLIDFDTELPIICFSCFIPDDHGNPIILAAVEVIDTSNIESKSELNYRK